MVRTTYFIFFDHTQVEHIFLGFPGVVLGRVPLPLDQVLFCMDEAGREGEKRGTVRDREIKDERGNYQLYVRGTHYLLMS